MKILAVAIALLSLIVLAQQNLVQVVDPLNYWLDNDAIAQQQQSWGYQVKTPQ